MTGALLTLDGLTKAYPGVVANDHISLSLAPGRIHALLGENGAGKSTLVKMIYGLTRPDSGTMILNGAPFAPSSPKTSRAAGISLVFQHFSLFDNLTVAENIALGLDDGATPAALAHRITEVSHSYGLPLDPQRLTGDLSVGERQRVEIIRCLLQQPRLLIMDEPTSVLTPGEAETLFATLRRLASEGTAILYISHKLNEIRSLCQDATILRQGRVVGTCTPKDTSTKALAEMMVGDTLPDRPTRVTQKGELALQAHGLSAPSPRAFGTALRDIYFDLYAGEILGIGGVAGNGQDELLAALSGELRVDHTMLALKGRPIGQDSPNRRRSAGLLCAPEERMGHAAVPELSLTQNTALTANGRMGFAGRGLLRWSRARAFATKVIDAFDVRTRGPDALAAELSGGNLQKFLIGREVLQDPAVLVVNQPTWGVDAAAAAAIRHALTEIAAHGAAVIVISQDLDELVEISDSFAALVAGQLSKPRPMADLSSDDLGLLLGGANAA